MGDVTEIVYFTEAPSGSTQSRSPEGEPGLRTRLPECLRQIKPSVSKTKPGEIRLLLKSSAGGLSLSLVPSRLTRSPCAPLLLWLMGIKWLVKLHKHTPPYLGCPHDAMRAPAPWCMCAFMGCCCESEALGHGSALLHSQHIHSYCVSLTDYVFV